MATPGIRYLPGVSTPVWDVSGDGSQGYIEVYAEVPLTGNTVQLPKENQTAYDVSGSNGSQGYVEPVAQIN